MVRISHGQGIVRSLFGIARLSASTPSPHPSFCLIFIVAPRPVHFRLNSSSSCWFSSWTDKLQDDLEILQPASRFRLHQGMDVPFDCSEISTNPNPVVRRLSCRIDPNRDFVQTRFLQPVDPFLAKQNEVAVQIDFFSLAS